VGYQVPAPGSEERNQLEKNEDFVDVWDFMTPAMKASVKAGNLSVDTAPAFQAALDYASGKAMNGSGHGRRVRFRGGTYLWSTPVAFDWRSIQLIVDAGDMRRPTLEGEGSANSVIFYNGDPAVPALTLKGYSGGAHGGVDMFMSLSGFWLRRVNWDKRVGVGLQLNQLSHIFLDDVSVDQFDTNIDIIDTIRITANNCRITGANFGLFARVAVYTHPN